MGATGDFENAPKVDEHNLYSTKEYHGFPNEGG